MTYHGIRISRDFPSLEMLSADRQFEYPTGEWVKLLQIARAFLGVDEFVGLAIDNSGILGMCLIYRMKSFLERHIVSTADSTWK